MRGTWRFSTQYCFYHLCVLGFLILILINEACFRVSPWGPLWNLNRNDITVLCFIFASLANKPPNIWNKSISLFGAVTVFNVTLIFLLKCEPFHIFALNKVREFLFLSLNQVSVLTLCSGSQKSLKCMQLEGHESGLFPVCVAYVWECVLHPESPQQEVCVWTSCSRYEGGRGELVGHLRFDMRQKEKTKLPLLHHAVQQVTFQNGNSISDTARAAVAAACTTG